MSLDRVAELTQSVAAGKPWTLEIAKCLAPAGIMVVVHVALWSLDVWGHDVASATAEAVRKLEAMAPPEIKL